MKLKDLIDITRAEDPSFYGEVTDRYLIEVFSEVRLTMLFGLRNDRSGYMGLDEYYQDLYVDSKTLKRSNGVVSLVIPNIVSIRHLMISGVKDELGRDLFFFFGDDVDLPASYRRPVQVFFRPGRLVVFKGDEDLSLNSLTVTAIFEKPEAVWKYNKLEPIDWLHQHYPIPAVVQEQFISSVLQRVRRKIISDKTGGLPIGGNDGQTEDVQKTR